MKLPESTRLPWMVAGATAAACVLSGIRIYRRLGDTPALSESSRQSGIKGEYLQAGPWRMFTRSFASVTAPN
jgi:hypothetical protein